MVWSFLKHLFGLIIWYQRPLDGITGVTGLFSNPNYLSAWLIIIWPFSLAMMEFDKEKLFYLDLKKFLIALISIFLVLTASRAALICLIISIPIFFGIKLKKMVYFFVWDIGFHNNKSCNSNTRKKFPRICKSNNSRGIMD